MSTRDIAVAMRRAESVLRRRPEAGLQDDAPVLASWQGGTRVVARHAGGTTLMTDMPTALGGSGDQVSPGWVLRAALASCLATCIAMNAAARGIALTQLEVRATSRSDTRGLLGMNDADDRPVSAGPNEVALHVRVAAERVPAAQLRALVEDSQRCSPVPAAVLQATPILLHIDVVDPRLG